jgi:endo-1,4-beta-D-glucanase Y
LKEDYDVGRFSPNLETKEEVSKENTVSETKVWYSFPEEDVDNDLTITSKIIGSADGFRVSVYSTDDLEEIKEVQLRLEEVKGINQVYSVFEPPFYKLYIGDFSIVEDAISLKNKLNQLGFKEAKVIRTTISLFEK